jgi:hypothetical protein
MFAIDCTPPSLNRAKWVAIIVPFINLINHLPTNIYSKYFTLFILGKSLIYFGKIPYFRVRVIPIIKIHYLSLLYNFYAIPKDNMSMYVISK